MIEDLRKALELLEQVDYLLSGYPEYDDPDYLTFEDAVDKLEELVTTALRRRELHLSSFETVEVT